MHDAPPKAPDGMPWGTLAWCRISDADGYSFIGELVETRTGFLMRTFAFADDPLPKFHDVDVKIDIATELLRLQMATLPANKDPRRGGTAVLEIVAEERWLKIPFQRPLTTTPYRDDAVDRLYKAICGWP